MKTLGTLLMAACLSLLAACSNDDSSKAPNVSFETLTGDQFTMQDLRGQVVVLKFWATDCTTCVAQMPDTIQYYQTYHDQGYEVLGIAMAHDPESYVRNFTESRQLPFPVVLDKDGSIAKAFGDIRLTPTTFLVDKQGNIVRRYVGNYDKAAFTQSIERALAG
ncbi:MAG TPA: TlpA family protein disulfide reductase [Candidatus Paenalcaligenes intestinipullorum]|uniref:TlpA family protein disulfide reductase n=1 Tax=Candidatus Paenalcaligenes intestinipullorum TaxID=2838718 RepID=A0A9D2U7B6_9BURK|nr:TlpA family protein disulfide reductase [Candidatus Paenalcaligenes intestinipullorum]